VLAVGAARLVRVAPARANCIALSTFSLSAFSSLSERTFRRSPPARRSRCVAAAQRPGGRVCRCSATAR